MKLYLTLYDRIVLEIRYDENENIRSASYHFDGKVYRVDTFIASNDLFTMKLSNRELFDHPAIESGELVLDDEGEVNSRDSFSLR